MALTQYAYLLFFFLFFSNFSFTVGQMVPAVFVFGDSLVDVGNNNYLTLSFAKADFPHNGIDFPGKKATGRFTNGKNAADLLAEKVGLPTSPPYLSIRNASNKTNAFLGGVNFASGGAGILDGTDKVFGQSIPLNKQIEYYSAVQTELVGHLGAVPSQKYLSQALHLIAIGSNDLLGYFGKDSTLNIKSTPQQYVGSMTVMFKAQLKRMYETGARKFVVAGTGAIGCCPSQRTQNKTGECNEEANFWSHKYYEGVKTLLQGMKSEFKDMNFALFDTYNLLLSFIQKPTDYGFKEVKSACCGLGNLNAKVGCLPISEYCSNRTDHVFWDFYHPTEAANRVFVDIVFDGSQQYMYPINVKQLVSM